MNRNNIKIWLLFQLLRLLLFLLRNLLQLLIHIKDSIKQAQLATIPKYPLSSLKRLFTTLLRAKFSVNCLNIMNKLTITRLGIKIQALEFMITISQDRSNSILLVKTLSSNRKSPMSKTQKRSLRHLDLVHIRL